MDSYEAQQYTSIKRSKNKASHSSLPVSMQLRIKGRARQGGQIK